VVANFTDWYAANGRVQGSIDGSIIHEDPPPPVADNHAHCIVLCEICNQQVKRYMLAISVGHFVARIFLPSCFSLTNSVMWVNYQMTRNVITDDDGIVELQIQY
jgi:hypothetical protein